MMERADGRTPNPAALRKQIQAARKAFGNYNVVRLGELIRRLPEKRRISFETVPILLHMNVPGLPGFVDNPETPHGIHRFSESGFWKMGKRRLGIQVETTKSFLVRRYFVRGVYLVGSSGTHGQTGHSDLNYWVLVDREGADVKRRELLSEKLDRIKAWALKDHGQALTFLVLNLDQVQKNDFPGVISPCIGLPQGSLIKEEFYRTFMLIAGQIPFWAVLPAGLNGEEYNRWIEAAGQSSEADFIEEDYIDLGHLGSIKREECPGALIAEILRFRQDPVRSLIKASLVAYHFLFEKQQGLLCEDIKRAYSSPKSGSESPDPFVRGFEGAIGLHESIEDRDGLDLIKKCVYLRLSGYPGPRYAEETNPNRDILNRFRRKWDWSQYEADRTESYEDWTEEERLGLEDRILKQLWFLFRMVAPETGEKPRGGEGTDPMGLDALRSKAEERFAKKPDQIPYASAYLRARREPLSLHVEPQQGGPGTDRWAVFDQASRGSTTNKALLFSDPQLPRVVGWIVLNGLYTPESPPVLFQRFQSTIAARRAEAFLKEVFGFFPMQETDMGSRSETVWEKLLVALDLSLGPKQSDLTSPAFLIQNTWGEIFCFSLDLTSVENNLLRCYEIAKEVWKIQRQSAETRFEYRIYPSSTIEGSQAAKNIVKFLESLRNDNPGKPDS